MALSLPEPKTIQLEHAPLELVVCQVKHELNMAVADAGRALSIAEALSHAYPRVEVHEQKEVNLIAFPGGLTPTGSEQRGWRFRSQDEAWTVALLPEYFALECTGYTSWTEFRTRFEELTDAIDKHLRPAMQTRVGLRYIDKISYPRITDPAKWQGLIRDSLLGPLLHPSLGPTVTGAQGVFQMDAGNARVLLRHGIQKGPEDIWPYLLDTDCFVELVKRFDADALMKQVRDLHTLALQIFQAAVTEELFQTLSGSGS
jgi:uncharacterized protein (TIGR04255 family)